MACIYIMDHSCTGDGFHCIIIMKVIVDLLNSGTALGAAYRISFEKCTYHNCQLDEFSQAEDSCISNS